jgi:5-methylcytosine-specific restriction endonuclease McrA
LQCKVDDCGRPARYKAACLCQKHYFRVRRYGTTETTKVGKGRDRYVTPAGYVYVRRPEHPLAIKNGLVAEHRAVVYDDLGPGPMNCELCGVVVTWERVHIDHIDETTENNVRTNLRPTCNACNTQRGRAPEHTYCGRLGITYEGVTKTAHEWASDPRVAVTGKTIRARLNAGQTVEQALFGAKATHNGNTRPADERRRAKAKKLKESK